MSITVKKKEYRYPVLSNIKAKVFAVNDHHKGRNYDHLNNQLSKKR